jgi:hypothetical protein
VVVVEEDRGEVERRTATLQADLAPKTSLGAVLVEQLALLSVRMERGAKHEEAQIATRVRHAAEDFDAAHLDRVEDLMARLGENPRKIGRELRRSPEGLDALIEAWRTLRRELTREARPMWTIVSLEQAARLTGRRVEDLAGTRLDALGRATWGSFTALTEADRSAASSDEALKVRARLSVIEMIDAEIASLEAQANDLDRETRERDRAEAGDRALFDPSREASLARRYESEARRGFFKALDQLRQVEAEAAQTAQEAEVSQAGDSPLGSSREMAPRALREPRPSDLRPARPASDGRKIDLEPELLRDRTFQRPAIGV